MKETTSFWQYLRLSSIFKNVIRDSQYQGITRAVDFYMSYCFYRNIPHSYDHIAYILASIFHETGSRMHPLRENMTYTTIKAIRSTFGKRIKSDEEARLYLRNPKALANKVYGGRFGNTDPDDGWKYRGCGEIQLTFKDNYKFAGDKLGLNLLDNPERMIVEADISTEIAVRGMMEGWFTGIKLNSGKPFNAIAARGIVNPDGNGLLVSSYFHIFKGAFDRWNQTQTL